MSSDSYNSYSDSDSDSEDSLSRSMTIQLNDYEYNAKKFRKDVENIPADECLHLIYFLVQNMHGWYDVGPYTINRLFYIKALNEVIQDSDYFNEDVKFLINYEVESNWGVRPTWNKWGRDFEMSYVHHIIDKKDLTIKKNYTYFFEKIYKKYNHEWDKPLEGYETHNFLRWCFTDYCSSRYDKERALELIKNKNSK